ncbi:hypothetical protein [Kordia sp.]|uniref:hypothetical protein n=1 Tax=Kordia sp. TaxID=1965332 RepID=UPI003D291489
MKYLFYLFSVFVFTDGCNDKASETETIKGAQDEISIVYEASTRGFYEKINISKEKLSVTKIRNGKVSVEQDMSSEDWNELVTLLDKIDSEKLKDNYTNTDDVGRDAVIPATLAIKYKDDTVKSITLTHGNPPETLVPLMNKIQAMVKAVDKP